MARRASTSEQARAYRKAGHENALLFALELGLGQDYENDRHAKKDVIDPSGDAHSVKSGEKKWQIFLYARNRFATDNGFQGLNGVGDLLIRCIDAFPPSYDEYRATPAAAKHRLQIPMRALCNRFQHKRLLRAFLMKAIFNGGEVNYLTILHDDRFHVFLNTDVVRTMADSFEIVNSAARRSGEFDAQKVLFRQRGFNIGELEMRNDSPSHYREIRFNMNCVPAKNLLFETLQPAIACKHSAMILVYGGAAKRFGRWPSKSN